MISTEISTRAVSFTKPDLYAVADEIARSLAFTKGAGEAPLIVTPLLYPGGSRVVLSLRQHPRGFFVSDAGYGAREAELLGGSRLFARIAREQAVINDIRFDSDLIFDVDVPRQALVTAAMVVANASKTAVELTAFRLAERRNETQLEDLFGRLESAFGVKNVVRDAEVNGAASTWKVDALVLHPERPAILEMVSANANSVNATVTKFLDISRSHDADRLIRFSVLANRDKTPHIGVLSATSRLVTVEAAPKAIAA
ncbi:hypothetical protein [Microvirga antarctica]|uniref:hypothetical protein n=1 Tax=Microvirga antarctica TaxID=2819233 RepID=UPI001B30E48A|nr:hypothetical protein [Microvirga antarctica]